MPIYVRDNRGGNWFWLHNIIVTDYGKEIGPHGIAVYAALACHADKEQQTWVSQKALAEEIGSSRAQVQRELAKLKQLGLVQVDEQMNEHGQTSNTYLLLPVPEPEHPRISQRRGSLTERRGGSTGMRPPLPPEAPYQFMNKTHGTRGSTPHKKDESMQDRDAAVDGSTHSNGHAGDVQLDVWQAVLADLQEQMVPANFTRWLARTSLLSHDGGTAVVGVPDQVSAEQLAKRFDPLVRRALADACGETVTVQYRVVED